MFSAVSTIATAVLLVLAEPTFATMFCYFFNNSPSPKLPPKAKSTELTTAFDANFSCTKEYQQVKEYDAKTGAYLGTKVSYSWFHRQFRAPGLIPEKCGDVIEDSMVATFGSVVKVYHRRYCTCCGENCNGRQLDYACTDEPVFTHKCYANDKSKSSTVANLPAEARLVDCTANQRCYKNVIMDEIDSYQWGCAYYPRVITDCNVPLMNFHTNSLKKPHYDKVCSCCGEDGCNGAGLDGATVNNTYCGPPLKAKRTCYSAVNNSPRLPGDAANFTRPDMDQEGSACVKMYQLVKEYNVSTGEYIGKKTSYSWFHKEFTGTELIRQQCGDVIEESFQKTLNEKSLHYYQRMCTCCGENCNGRQMNTQCNEEPKFTHKCYSNDRSVNQSSGTIPANAVPVQSTKNQKCFKSAIVDDLGSFKWGCASYPSAAGKCGDVFIHNHSKANDSSSQPAHIDKVCTCCGELCNGAEQDGSTLNNTYCGPPRRKCYRAYEKASPYLPPDTPEVTEDFMKSNESACVKVFRRTFNFNSTTREFLGTSVYYSWYAKKFFQPQELLPEKCGDIVEISEFRMRSYDLATIYYTRSCSCCGDSCNGPEMNDKCNEEPEFAHECFGDDRSRPTYNTDPELSRTARPVYCTANQKCYKSAIEHEQDQIYHWGCASYPSAKPSGMSLIYDHPAGEHADSHVDKICLCEGHLCNGLFDEVTSNNTLCTLTKTTTTEEPTTVTTTEKGTAAFAHSISAWLLLNSVLVSLISQQKP